MRTTLVIDDDLIVSVKKLAAERGTNASAVVSTAVRQFLENREAREKGERFRMPTFEGDGPATDSLPSDLKQLDEEADLAAYKQ